MMEKIFERMCEGFYAECEIGEYLWSIFDNCFDLGWDDYDCSLEIKGIPNDFVFSTEQQQWFIDAGINILFVSKLNGICDCYSFWNNETNTFSPKTTVSHPSARPARQHDFALLRKMKADLTQANALLKELWMVQKVQSITSVKKLVIYYRRREAAWAAVRKYLEGK